MSRLHVFFNAVIESWVVRDFCDEHNHELVVPKLARMLRSHKKMIEPDISQMNHIKEVGISIPNIFGSLASQCGRYENVNFSSFEKNGSIETETTRKPKRCSYCRKGGHNIATCSMRKMDERTPQFDGDAEENVEGEDYSFVDTESDEYVHTEWFDNEDGWKKLVLMRYFELVVMV
ncbi:hypothetical protein HN873_037660 [Arachis hypogaea]